MRDRVPLTRWTFLEQKSFFSFWRLACEIAQKIARSLAEENLGLVGWNQTKLR